MLWHGSSVCTLRSWLNVSLATTNVYAEVDLEMKAKALANCEVKEKKQHKPWREQKGLMDFLRTL
jgi:integrase/recombinase XerD